MGYNASQRRGIWLLYIVITAVVTAAVIYDLVSRKQTTILPEDCDEEQYEEFVRNNHPDSLAARPYYKKKGGRKGYPDYKKPRYKKNYSHNTYYRKGKGGYTPYSSYGSGGATPASFAFDPNTADSTALLALGLSPFQVRNVYKYRASGGRYHRKEDFHRLYGLTVEQWNHLEPLIEIDERYRYVSDLSKESPNYVNDTLPRRVKYEEGQVVPLNRCDTNDLRKVPGIGDIYAGRIVRYRDRLGGFVNTAQLTEIRELPREVALDVAKWFSVEPSLVRRMNLNKLTLNQLMTHPYINFYQAKVITEHRRLYGPLKSLDELKLYEEFTENDFKRIAPYVMF